VKSSVLHIGHEQVPKLMLRAAPRKSPDERASDASFVSLISCTEEEKPKKMRRGVHNSKPQERTESPWW
jgi:hypothetical protein